MVYFAAYTPIQLGIIFTTIAGSVLVASFVMSRLNFLPDFAQASGRYVHIDGLRGIAALFVFMCHTSLMLDMLGMPNIFFHYANYELNGKFGSIGVQIFFCITGFLFTEKIIKTRGEMDWGQFFMNRIRRLAPLYFVATTMAILVAFFIRKTNQIDMGQTFVNWLKIYAFYFIPWEPVFGFNLHQLIGNAWTLAYEWRFYILMPVFFWFIKEGVWRIALPILLIIAILDLSASQFAVWPFFMGGIFTAFLTTKVQLRNKISKWVCTVLACVAIGTALFNDAHFFGLECWVLISVGFAFIMLGEPAVLKSKTLRYLGEISYSFYLFGVLFAYCVFDILKHMGIPSHIHFERFIQWEAMASVGIVVLATFTFRFIEYPFLRRKKIMDEVVLPTIALATSPVRYALHSE